MASERQPAQRKNETGQKVNKRKGTKTKENTSRPKMMNTFSSPTTTGVRDDEEANRESPGKKKKITTKGRTTIYKHLQTSLRRPEQTIVVLEKKKKIS